MCKNHRNPIHCIIPPYVTDKLVDNKNTKISEKALENEFRSYRFRSDRNFFATLKKKERKFFAIKKPGAVKAKAKIEIYDCGRKTTLPGKLLSAGSKDKDAVNVLNGTLQTWDFYYSILNRNSIDNEGMILVNSIHYKKEYQNALWNGRQMIYGDGDGKIFGSFTTDIDIIGHELTHGVTQYEANLDYENQSGALNESISDVFGIMIKQKSLNQDVKKSNWLIGVNVLLGKNYALRSLKAPGTAYKNHPDIGSDPQPATMDGYVLLPNDEGGDWGGVHYNSGIPNFAFYVAAYNMGGNAWEKIGKVWYAALTDILKPKSTFKDAKNATIRLAASLYGKGSLVEKAVKDGWKAAKV